ncbi:hypothetical protein NX059_006415 [Plenodomus lindquistii]|nr:hypothetical protein NX059_006415 [Plenodomus lindquistii]
MPHQNQKALPPLHARNGRCCVHRQPEIVDRSIQKKLQFRKERHNSLRQPATVTPSRLPSLIRRGSLTYSTPNRKHPPPTTSLHSQFFLVLSRLASPAAGTLGSPR